MGVGPKAATESAESSPVPNPVLDAARIREQLQRLLEHPLFANSKRYPALLAYAVEQALLGHAADLKERSIGVEVFGRPPAYDANADPVVRITAGEVRKRLTQYYYDPTHRGELIIELPTGSYVPQFRPAERLADPVPNPDPDPETPEIDSATILAPGPIEAANGTYKPARIPWWAYAAALLLAVAAAAGGLVLGLNHTSEPPPRSNIDRFWAPVTSSDHPTTFCLGEPAKNIDVGSINSFDTPPPNSQSEPLYFRLHYAGNLALADVITLTRTVAALASQHKAFRVVPASEATFAELREGPFVLIGAFDNVWTLRLTQKLRFGFESKDGVALLVDRHDARKTTWATAWDLPYQKLSRDYAIVARIHDSTTGQPVIIAAGISEEGTEAAGEILYNPVYLDSLLAKAPKNWEQANLEAVIQTQVIGGHPGPPSILAVETW